MRKAITFIIIMMMTLSSCTQNDGISKNDFSKPVYSFFSLSTYYKDGQYYVCNGFEDVIEEYLIFSKNRTLLRKVNFEYEPLNPNIVDSPDTLRSFLGKNMDDIEDILGTYHFDLASGISKPSYITSDAYLITFVLFNEEISVAAKTDLLTGCTQEYSVRDTSLH